MRLPLLPSTMSQPFCVVIVHDKLTNIPSFAFSNYGISTLDADTVKLDSYTVPLVLKVEDLQYNEARPSGLGNGLHRREVSFTIRNDGPFTTFPFTAELYSAGANTDSFYFSMWVTDFSRSLQDLRETAMFLGYFDLDAGVGWDESSITTTIKLVDRLTNLTGRYSTVTEAAEELLQGSEWQRLLDEPAYLGYRNNVPAYGRIVSTVSGFDAYQNSVRAVVAGIVTSSTLSGTSIQLGKSPSLAQFVGQSIKLKMGNGCLIQGIITNLGIGEYGIDTIGLGINLPWDTIKCFNRGWNTVGSHLNSGEGGADLSSIFLDGGLSAPSADDIALLGTATSTGGGASNINDNSETTYSEVTAALPIFFKIDLGAGNARIVGKIAITPRVVINASSIRNFQFQGSNDDLAWSTIYSEAVSTGNGVKQVFTFTPPTQIAYRYYRVNVTSRSGTAGSTGMYTLAIYPIAVVPGGTSLDKLPSPNMYIKTNGPVELYSGGIVTTAGPLFCKLTGVKDDANKELGCEPLKDPANPAWKFGGISVEFDAALPSGRFSDVDLLHLNYAIWLDKGTYEIYFSPKTWLLADVQKSGMPWELISTNYVNSSMVVEHSYYIKLVGTTTIAESASGQMAVYATDGSKLILITNADIASITYNCGAFSLPDLCRITLKRALITINESFDPNLLYTTTWPPYHAAEVMAYIMDQAGIGDTLRAPALGGTSYLGEAILRGNPLGVTIATETWTELLDSVVFESGLQIDTIYGVYTVRPSFTKSVPITFNNSQPAAQADTFMYATTDGVLMFSDVVDGTYKMDIGKMYTNISAGREFIRVHYTYDFVYSRFNGVQTRKLQSTRSVKSNDRKISYTFKHVVDTATATAAAQQLSRIGHAANIAESMRIVSMGMPFSYLGFQVLDTVRLVNFRHITRVNDPLPAYIDTSTTNPVYTLGLNGPYYKYTQDIPYALIPGIGIIDAISFNFSGSGVPVSITFRQMQINTASNIKAIAERVEILNDEAANVTDTNTEEDGGGGYPGQEFRCPPGTTLQNVVIIPGEVKQSSTTVSDPCCNSSTITGDVVTDPSVTILCVGVCETPEGCPDDEWPDHCLGDPTIRYTPQTDREIGNGQSLLFDLIYLMPGAVKLCPTLVAINYSGRPSPDYCVTYIDKCLAFNEGSTRFAILSVAPCVFNTPEGEYTKFIELVFDVPYCYQEYVIGGIPKPKETRVRRTSIVIPVTLRPVSDINVS